MPDMSLTYEEMEKEVKRHEIVAKIVQMIEDDSDFEIVAGKILKYMGEYLDVTNVCIYQPQGKCEMSGFTIQWSSDSKYEMNNDAKYGRYFGSHILSGCACDSDDDIKSYVTVPVMINDKCAMYLFVADKEKYIQFDDKTIGVIKDISKIVQNIAQRKVTRNSLFRSYGALTDILDNMGCGVMVIDKDTKKVLFTNRVAEESIDSQSITRECLDRMYYDGQMETKIEKFDAVTGAWYEVKLVDITWVDGRRVSLCTIIDITQIKKNQQKIEFQANNDFLTGLCNRRKCENDLTELIRKKGSGALMFLDLDDFKHINDGLGHQYGDILLKQIATGLSHISGIEDTCYRMGGDEFVIIVRPEEKSRINQIAGDILVMFNKPWYLYEAEYYCTMSMGIVEFPENGTDVHELIKKADIAMYDAKKAGKNRYAYYLEKKDKSSYSRLDIENSMRTAIATNCREFEVYYQPIIDNKTEKCIGCEALVRWNSRTLGFMTPDTFIPLAEYLGLITNIGDYVFEKACIKCKEWNEMGYEDFKVNVNLSVVQLLQNNVVENIRKIVRRVGIKPENLVLEITETLAINDMQKIMKIINQIKAMGIKIALDDFGTGYSSLNYIKQLSLDIIKVDQTFIKDITQDDYARAFLKLVSDLSKTIGVAVCVEGVENKEQKELLKQMDIELIQGYYYGMPMPAEKFEKKFLHISKLQK